MSTKIKQVIIIVAILLFLIAIAVAGIQYFAKPSKAELVTGLDNAFEYYRSGGIVLPPVAFYPDAYQQQYWFDEDGRALTMREYMLEHKLGGSGMYPGSEELSHFDTLPSDLMIPEVITLDDFIVKRPSREVVAIVAFNGYKAHCTMKYMGPYIMEWFPRPDWQVVSVQFIAD